MRARSAGATRRRRWGLAAVVFLGLAIASTAVPSCSSSTPGRRAGPATSGRAVGKSCTECHGDVLTALETTTAHFDDLGERCEDCHDRHGLVGVLKLKQEEPALCLGCHEDAAGYLDAHPHAPVAEGRCSACHQPHGSEHPLLMRAAGAELCFECHDRSAFETGTVHEPVSKDCSTCHDPHTNASSLGTTQAVPDLCAECHDSSTDVFVEAHGGHDVSGANCGSCHSPHASTAPALLRPVVHEPLADRDCSMCHVEPEDVTAGVGGPETIIATEKLCGVCHADAVAQYRGHEGQHAPVTEGKCVGCHSPHASEHSGLLVASADQALCVACHETDDQIAEIASSRGVLHPPATEGKCLDCHDPHGGGDAHLLRMPEDDLCLSCHEQVIAEFDREVVHAPLDVCTSCHASHGSNHRAILRMNAVDLCLLCHKEHDERFRSEQLHRPVAQGQCLVCHEAHAADHAGVLRKPKDAICLDCHANVAQTVDGGSVHTPAAKGECLECHDPHSAQDADLLVAHGGELCAKCHGMTQQAIAGAAFRHAPAEAGACLACHDAHAAPLEKLMTLPEEELCGTCHSDLIQEMYRPGSHRHVPAEEGKCLECHVPHASDFRGLAIEAVPGSCLKCHDASETQFQESHLGLTTDTTDCLACHSPHAAEGPGLFWPNRHPPFSEKKCEECHREGR